MAGVEWIGPGRPPPSAGPANGPALPQEEAERYGTRCIDLGLGSNVIKRRFANRERRHFRFLQPNRDRVLSTARNGWVRLANSVRDLPQRFGQ